MKGGASLVMALLVPAASCWAQVPDLCAEPLPYQAELPAVQKFRLQCTIQKLLAERADEANKATAAEVQAAVEAAHAKAQTEALAKANERAEYWEHYAAGLVFQPKLSSALDDACAWRGTQNEPTARMCRIWKQR